MAYVRQWNQFQEQDYLNTDQKCPYTLPFHATIMHMVMDPGATKKIVDAGGTKASIRSPASRRRLAAASTDILKRSMQLAIASAWEHWNSHFFLQATAVDLKVNPSSDNLLAFDTKQRKQITSNEHSRTTELILEKFYCPEFVKEIKEKAL